MNLNFVVTSIGEPSAVAIISRLCSQVKHGDLVISVGSNTSQSSLDVIHSLKCVYPCLRHYELDYLNGVDAKNLGASIAEFGSWVVQIDADEWVDSLFADKVRSFAEENPHARCGYLRRINIVHNGDGRIPEIKWENLESYQAWPDLQRRVYRAGCGKWVRTDKWNDYYDVDPPHVEVGWSADSILIHLHDKSKSGGSFKDPTPPFIQMPVLFSRGKFKTWDDGIFNEVNAFNCYKLPNHFRSDDVIVDLGAHIGSFAYACVNRGAGRVVCFEPDECNFQKLSENTSRFMSSVSIRNSAVWRSDQDVESIGMVQFDRDNSESNTGGGTIMSGSGSKQVPVVKFDDVISDIGVPIRILKLDVEGSEYPILYTSKNLNMIQQIVMEYHGLGDVGSSADCGMPNTGSHLASFLQKSGFHVIDKPTEGGSGYMYAFNKGWV